MPKKPTRRNPKVSFVRRRKGRGDTYFIPKRGKVGKAGATVERHIRVYKLPKVKFGNDNGDKLARAVEVIYNRLARLYKPEQIAAAAYTISGRGAWDIKEDGKPDWERQEFAIHRNYMSFSKNARDARERIRAYGDNDFTSLLGTTFKHTRSKPVFFLPKKITISLIGKPGKPLREEAPNRSVSTTKVKAKSPAKVIRAKAVRKKRHRS